MACAQTLALPLACRMATDDVKWRLVAARDGRACPAGWLARPPTNGFANSWLHAAGGNATVLLNVSADGREGSPALA